MSTAQVRKGFDVQGKQSGAVRGPADWATRPQQRAFPGALQHPPQPPWGLTTPPDAVSSLWTIGRASGAETIEGYEEHIWNRLCQAD